MRPASGWLDGRRQVPLGNLTILGHPDDATSMVFRAREELFAVLIPCQSQAIKSVGQKSERHAAKETAQLVR